MCDFATLAQDALFTLKVNHVFIHCLQSWAHFLHYFELYVYAQQYMLRATSNRIGIEWWNTLFSLLIYSCPEAHTVYKNDVFRCVNILL